MGENRGSSSHRHKPHPAKLQVVPAVDLARVFTNLTPSSPSPLKERGKRFIERGETPLLPTRGRPPPSLAKGRGSGGWVAKQSPCNV